MRTEDQVRDAAKKILEFEDDGEAISGVGQITTFNQLGITGNNKKPDGWYLPHDIRSTAIVLETKASSVDIDTKKCVDEIREYGTIIMEKYDNVIGILYNGKNTRVFRNNIPVEAPNDLQKKSFYIDRIKEEPVDKKKIYSLTAKINNSLHYDFGIKNLYSRMVFTAAALVAERYSQYALIKGMNYDALHNSIKSNLNKSLENSRRQNQKLDIIIDVYSDIRMNYTENQKSIDNFIKNIKEISTAINSNHWAGEDVMGIFFNEFNRYKGKSEQGQVFTPDHITNLMYRLIDCSMNDYILDAACGSGAFLVKAMSNMIVEAGGVDTNKAKEIKSHRLYGIENDKEIFALACANMLIHKDGKTNFEYLDSRTIEAGNWIKEKPITKVLMNPPFENRYGWDKILLNVLGNVKKGTLCAFILPEKKLELASKKFKTELFGNHKIKTIVKLPEEVFLEGITTAIYIIEAGYPQNDHKIIAYNIEDDGLETIKNQGRQDIYNNWKEYENYWVEAIRNGEDPKYGTKQILDPKVHISWQKPLPPFVLLEDDFKKTMIDYGMFKSNINPKKLMNSLIDHVLYNSKTTVKNGGLHINISSNEEDDEYEN